MREPEFRALYAEHYPAVLRYALRRLGSRGLAEELAQEVFLTAWRRRFDIPPRVLPWLYGVARRLLANEWRKRRPDTVELSDVPAPTGGVDELLDVRAALATLSESDQELLRLIGWEQLTLAEAASVLGCPRPVAAVRVHRARRRLLAALGEAPSPRRRIVTAEAS